MNIKILGTGCAKCHKLYKMIDEIIESEKIDATVEKVQDMKEIMGFGVMATPGLVIDDEVIFSGSLPSKKQLIKMIVQ
jgi:small redox-active disulfide protein 2